MEKIYGYRQSDISGLVKFIKENKGRSLSQVFALYGNRVGKAKGTVRNMYYALAKHSLNDAEFCKKYLDGKPLQVEKIVEFDENEEKELIKKILAGRKEGRSVRSIIMELAGGDAKLALRYQNKFRNALKGNSHLVAEVITEIKSEKGFEVPVERKAQTLNISEFQFKKLKTEIDNLINRISSKLRQENDYLKSRIATLELENMRFRNILYGNSKAVDAIKFIGRHKDENVLN